LQQSFPQHQLQCCWKSPRNGSASAVHDQKNLHEHANGIAITQPHTPLQWGMAQATLGQAQMGLGG
jgi:hypothetical protein